MLGALLYQEELLFSSSVISHVCCMYRLMKIKLIRHIFTVDIVDKWEAQAKNPAGWYNVEVSRERNSHAIKRRNKRCP